MADFATALKMTSLAEGGLSNDPDDSGGLTYMGISYNNFPNWEGWPIVKANEPQLSKGIDNAIGQQLQPMVERFYRLNFWQPINGDFINDQTIANGVFDMAVNGGVTEGVMIIQHAVNMFIANPSQCLKIDGAMGKLTVGAIDAVIKTHPLQLEKTFTCLRGSFYVKLVDANPKYKKFFLSWITRS